MAFTGMYDHDPELPQTRHRLFEMAATEKALMVGHHFPFPGLGHVEKDGQGYRLVPIGGRPVRRPPARHHPNCADASCTTCV